MKKIIGLALLLFLAQLTVGQNSKVKRGLLNSWIEKVSFDKGAQPDAGEESSYYYLLIDEQENISEQESFNHFVYKILSNEGLQDMSDISAEFDPSYEQLIFHTVLIHRGDQVIEQLPKEIRTIQREQSMDRYLYDGSLTAIINLADVRVNDIVEYSYTKKGYNPVYDGHFGKRLNFNYYTSLEKSFKQLVAPSNLPLYFKYTNEEIRPQINSTGRETVYTWSSNKVKANLTDSNEPDWYDSFNAVQVSTFDSWDEMAKWSARRYQVSDRDKQTVARELAPKFKSETKEEYILKVIRFVQDEVRYLGFESGLNSHLPHPPADVYTQRFGDCKDKSLLLSALLNANGIESYPVLVNTYYREKIANRLPSINAFNHCVVEFMLDEKTIYIDPTISSQGGKLNNYSFPNYGKGLVVKSTTTDLVEFPTPVQSTISEVHTFELATIGGEAMVTIETTYSGSEADYQRSYYADNSLERIQKNYLSYYGNLYPDIEKFDDIEVHDDREINLFKIKEKYKIPTFWKPYEGNEQKIYCEFYPLTLESYFNVSKSVNRTSPYRITYPFDYSHEITVQLPEEWTINDAKQRLESDYYEYDFKVSYGNKIFSMYTDYRTKTDHIPVADFQKFVADHGKMMSNLSYSLTYDKSLIAKSTNAVPGIVVSVISLFIGVALVIALYKKYDPVPPYPEAWGTPIGGWLILVGIGVSFTPVRIIYDLLMNDYFLSGQSWLTYWYAESYGYSLFLFLEHVYNIVFLLYSGLILVLFFQKRSSVPLLISIFYGVSCVVTILDSILANQIDPNSVIDSKEIARAIFAAAIWIPYFQMSQRVKKTFVVVLDGNSGNELPNEG